MFINESSFFFLCTYHGSRCQGSSSPSGVPLSSEQTCQIARLVRPSQMFWDIRGTAFRFNLSNGTQGVRDCDAGRIEWRGSWKGLHIAVAYGSRTSKCCYIGMYPTSASSTSCLAHDHVPARLSCHHSVHHWVSLRDDSEPTSRQEGLQVLDDLCGHMHPAIPHRR